MNNLFNVKFDGYAWAPETNEWAAEWLHETPFVSVSDWVSSRIKTAIIGGGADDGAQRLREHETRGSSSLNEIEILTIPIVFRETSDWRLSRLFILEFDRIARTGHQPFKTWVTILNSQEQPQWQIEYNDCRWFGEIPLPVMKRNDEIWLESEIELSIQASKRNFRWINE